MGGGRNAMSESRAAGSPNEQTTTEPGATERKLAPAPLEPEDFYYENGLIVFTAAYHLKRGYCCNSGCRHCPFADR
jgi:hypothetical protein